MDAAANCRDLNSLSEHLSLAPQHLFDLVKYSDGSYFSISVSKRNGGVRQISIPSTELKGVQKLILRLILNDLKIHPSAYAYRKSYSITMAAQRISGEKNVLRVDLQDFFPSITSKRIFGLLRKEGFGSAVAFMLTELMTLNHQAPQGAPTSPAISNAIAFKMDKELHALAKAWRCEYIRYSDDIFFSSMHNLNSDKLTGLISKIASDNGFRLNEEKTRYFPKSRARVTLGLETSGKSPRIPREGRRRARAIFFKASRTPVWAAENLQLLRGMAGWHKSVYGPDETYQYYRKIISSVNLMKFHSPYRG